MEHKSVKMNKEPNRDLFHYVGIKCETSSEVALGTVTKVHTLHASDLYDDDTIKIKEEPRDDCEEFDAVIGGDEARGALIGCGESQSRFIVKHEESSSQNSLSQSSELQDVSLAALCSVNQLPPSLPPSLPPGCQQETQTCGPIAPTPESRELQRRCAVIELLRTGKAPKDILKLLPYPRCTVYDIAARFNEAEKLKKGTGTPSRKIRNAPRNKRTKNAIKRAQNMISKEPGVSLTKLAAKLNVSLTTMRRIAAEDLRYKSDAQQIRKKTQKQQVACPRPKRRARSVQNEVS